jgi:hypothetical protein
MIASYEAYALLNVVTETGNLHCFKGIPIPHLAKWLQDHFTSHDDRFITTDPVLSKLDFSKIRWLPVAAVLSAGGSPALLDSVWDAEFVM